MKPNCRRFPVLKVLYQAEDGQTSSVTVWDLLISVVRAIIRGMTCYVFCARTHYFTHHCLTGLAFGGLWGVQEGMRRDLGTSSFKLRLNSVLNSVTRRGIFLGNSLGVLGQCALFFLSCPRCYHLIVPFWFHLPSLDVQCCQLDD